MAAVQVDIEGEGEGEEGGKVSVGMSQAPQMRRERKLRDKERTLIRVAERTTIGGTKEQRNWRELGFQDDWRAAYKILRFLQLSVSRPRSTSFSRTRRVVEHWFRSRKAILSC